MAKTNGEGVHSDYRADKKNKTLKNFIKGLASAATFGGSNVIDKKLGSTKNVVSAWKNLPANLKQVNDEKYSNDTAKRSDELIAAIKKQRPWKQVKNKAEEARRQAEYDKKYGKKNDFMTRMK